MRDGGATLSESHNLKITSVSHQSSKCMSKSSKALLITMNPNAFGDQDISASVVTRAG